MQPAVVWLDPNNDTRFAGSDGRLELIAPAGAITTADVAAAGGRLGLMIRQIAPASGSTAGGSGHFSFGTFLVQVVDSASHLRSAGLRKSLTVELHYGLRDRAFDLSHAFAVINGSVPEGIVLNPDPAGTGLSATTAGLGAPATQTLTLDTSKQTLTASPSAGTPSTTFSFNTDSPVASFGKPDPFNVDLSAGSLTAGYPIDVPRGPGGLTPPIVLGYSSAAVAEQHNAQAAAPWVGEGWNLSLGSISWAEHNATSAGSTATWEDSWQLNDAYGTAAELIPPNINVTTATDDSGNPLTASPITWHTAPETHAKVISYAATSLTADPAAVSWGSGRIDLGFLYDNLGNRVEQQVTQGGSTTPTIYVGNLEEVVTSGSTTTFYYAGSARIALAVNGTFSYLASDGLASATVALNATGSATASTLYGPYGGSRYSSGTMPTDYGFTGQHADAATGLDYYNARYYDSTAGQFTSADTILPGDGYETFGLSRYAYVEGNPETRTDPSGCCPWCIAAVIGAAIGGGLSYGSQVVGNLQRGQSLGSALTHVDVAEIGKQMLVGFVIGGTGGLGGAALGGRFVLGGVQGGAAQIGNNLLHGRSWSQDVLQSTGIGLATAGLSAGGGSAIRQVQKGFASNVLRDGLHAELAGLRGAVAAEEPTVLFEARLGSGDFPGRSAEFHFSQANAQLHVAFEADPAFAEGMESSYPGIVEGVRPGPRGGFPRRAPTEDLTWHHATDDPGLLQLLLRDEHQAPGPIQEILHPGGRGGMEIWGGGY